MDGFTFEKQLRRVHAFKRIITVNNCLWTNEWIERTKPYRVTHLKHALKCQFRAKYLQTDLIEHFQNVITNVRATHFNGKLQNNVTTSLRTDKQNTELNIKSHCTDKLREYSLQLEFFKWKAQQMDERNRKFGYFLFSSVWNNYIFCLIFRRYWRIF